ncbi:hypothetical protein L3X38_007981 [Prunus dulcis]|uniref:Uncharacterized protein n=1 Tax=Prunus dulcis TaxID=3755 RepID=A0AAD4ZW06_PRUDU|nr:hypothetical protein L3X38_007981 [Prunus dulcis]
MAWRLGREMQRTGTVGPDYVLEVHVFLDFGKAMSLVYHGSLNISFDLSIKLSSHIKPDEPCRLNVDADLANVAMRSLESQPVVMIAGFGQKL